MFDLNAIKASERRSEEIAKLCGIPLRDVISKLINKKKESDDVTEEKN